MSDTERLEATWWVVVEIPQSKVAAWGDAVFDAVCEAAEGVTDRRGDWDPFVWSADAAHALLAAAENASLADAVLGRPASPKEEKP